MATGQMVADEMFVNKMTTGKMSVDKMLANKMPKWQDRSIHDYRQDVCIQKVCKQTTFGKMSADTMIIYKMTANKVSVGKLAVDIIIVDK